MSSGDSRSGACPRSGQKRRRAAATATSSSTSLFSGIPASLVNKDCDYLCPICFEMFKEAHMTKCGHSFCHACILRCLEQSPRCPKCNCHLDNSTLIPNFVLEELVAKAKTKAKKASKDLPQDLKRLLMASERGGLQEIDDMIRVLVDKRQEIESESFLTQHTLMSEFLTHLKRRKDDELMRLKRECDVIQDDLTSVQDMLATMSTSESKSLDQNVPPVEETTRYPTVPDEDEGFNVYRQAKKSTLPQRRRRMNDHFEDLSSFYFQCRAEQMIFPGEDDIKQPEKKEGLQKFSSCLSKFTRYSRLHPLATLNYATDIFTTASIVSSIEFDKDNEFFAIAGVTKRIKVYDYDVILKDMVDIHYPCNEMVCSSKISCISWNTFHKSTLASSDYDCSVIVWDAATGQKVKTFQEHEKRCWSVDFNSIDTKLLASGSDDSRVKLWSANMNHSVASLEAKANVCCVKFNPSSCYHIAFGSADHCVHYYDLRQTKSALNVFKGHKKAVSYVKFLNSTDLVSASTDSQLKLWDVNQKHCVRSFTGHTNEKNFVGLATDGDYITCGSENNGLYMYYKGLSKPLFNFKFDTMRSLLERTDSNNRRDEDNTNEFVSAVCWRQNSPIVVAANSQGTIKVLELV